MTSGQGNERNSSSGGDGLARSEAAQHMQWTARGRSIFSIGAALLSSSQRHCQRHTSEPVAAAPALATPSPRPVSHSVARLLD